MTINTKINVGILCGGKSAEHEVSLQSAMNVIEAIDKDKYEVILIGIDKLGVWFLLDSSDFLINKHDPKIIALNLNGAEKVAILPGSQGLLTVLDSTDQKIKLDVVFPILHGPQGEDGTVQGLLKLAEVPFVGAGVLGASVGMDKDIMKRLLRDAGVPIGKFVTFKQKAEIVYADVVADLGLPLFIKPANLGSSVGVNKAKDEASFTLAIREAFKHDTKIIIEEFIDGRELECAVLGNQDPEASGVGEIIPTHEFYSYEAKYVDSNGAKTEIPAKVDKEVSEKVQELAIATFNTLACEGLGRVDCFLKKDGSVVVNEINTLPGFTKISMYPKLWAEVGVSYPELIDRLITLATERFENEERT